MTFSELDLNESLVSAVNALGYEEPTPIQREAIPALLSGRDVLGQAATGTGKTAAFALPLLNRIAATAGNGRIQALVLVPTRELAEQVAQAVHKYGRLLRISVLPVYGGQSMGLQLRALRRGIDVVVATPGRALDHLQRGTLDLNSVQVLVLDEADEMLDMGFADELEALVAAVPKERQTALFSATLAPRIKSIAKRYLNDFVNVSIPTEKPAAGSVPRVRETAYIVARAHKAAALARVIDMESPQSAIVFCRTRTEVDELTETLGSRGYQAEAIHGGLSQEQRDRVLKRFREGQLDILVATDVAARGLDIEHVSHVFNFDVPTSPDQYVHRIGRTGRAGREGVAITLAEPRERRLLRIVEMHTGRKLAVENVPSVHDLRARRAERLRESVSEVLEGGDYERYRSLIERLADNFDVYDIAAAALSLADRVEEGAAEAVEIPPNAAFQEREAPRGSKRPQRRDGKAPANGNIARMYVGIGRSAGIKPGDLVGAIANEGGLSSKDIGSIDIADRHSIVEVPADQIDRVVKQLRNTMVRGRKLGARRDRM